MTYIYGISATRWSRACASTDGGQAVGEWPQSVAPGSGVAQVRRRSLTQMGVG